MSFQHLGKQIIGDQVQPPQVHIHDAVPGVRSSLVEPARQMDARVVEEDLTVAEFMFYKGGQGFDLFFVADVAGEEADLVPQAVGL